MNKRDQYLYILHKFLDKEAEVNYPKQFKLAKGPVEEYGFYFFIIVDCHFKPFCLSYFLTEEGKSILVKRFKYIALDLNRSKKTTVGDSKVGKDKKIKNTKRKFLNFKKY